MVKVALPETTWLEVGDMIFVDEDKIKNFEKFQKIDWQFDFQDVKKMCFVYIQKIFNLKHQAFKITPTL